MELIAGLANRAIVVVGRIVGKTACDTGPLVLSIEKAVRRTDRHLIDAGDTVSKADAGRDVVGVSIDEGTRQPVVDTGLDVLKIQRAIRVCDEVAQTVGGVVERRKDFVARAIVDG